VHAHIFFPYSASVIVHEIDVNSIFTFEIKDHSPISRYGDRPLPSPFTLERMKSETRQGHPIGPLAVVKRRKDAPQSRDALRRNTSRASLDKQPLQAPMPEFPDHGNL